MERTAIMKKDEWKERTTYEEYKKNCDTSVHGGSRDSVCDRLRQ